MGWKHAPRKPVIVLILMATMHSWMQCAAGEEGADDMQCIRSFFSDVLHCEAASIEQEGDKNEMINGYEVTEYAVNGDSRVWVSNQPHTVIGYRSNEKECSSSKDAPCISQTKAFEAALPILRYHGLPQDEAQYRFYKRDEGPGFGNTWSVSYRNPTIDGFPCINGFMSVDICAETGTIHGFHYSLPISPAPLWKPVLSKENAIAIARKWADDTAKRPGDRVSIDDDNIAKVRRVVVAAADVFTPGATGRPFKHKAYHCWEIPVLFSEMGFSLYPGRSMYVRVDTGYVLGIR